MDKSYFYNFLRKNIPSKIIPKNKKILITGSNGFIGKYLVYAFTDVFKEKNNLIYGLDINKNLNKSKNYKYFKGFDKIKKNQIPRSKI